MNDRFLYQVSTNLELEFVISKMQELLLSAKLKDRDKDYSEQESRIKILRNFQFDYLQTIEENRLFESRYTKAFIKTVHLVDENAALKQEIENLKKQLKF